MRVVMIGTGYVGLVSGACFADFGHDVVCVDKDADKIQNLNNGIMPIFEPGLAQLVESNVKDGRLSFTTEIKNVIGQADVVFIAVGTPSRRGDGHADTKFVFQAASEIAPLMDGYCVVVNKSTVPVGTGDEVEAKIREVNPNADFDVVSNPEFLREGAAIGDFKRPDRIVVGAHSDRANEQMRVLYRPLFLNETPMLITNRRTAEITKYAANAFLAMKISFINEIADLCDAVGANVQEVSRGIGLDNRIGSKFLHAGPGYGGSCFPKDTLALSQSARDYGVSVSIVDAAMQSNKKRKKNMANRIISAAGGDVKNKTISILGLTYKPNTDDMRDSPSLDIIPALQQSGAHIRAYDPEGMGEAAKLFDDVTYCNDAWHCMEGAHIAVILTEWDQFRALDLSRVEDTLIDKVLVDLRNIYSLDEIKGGDLNYHSIGRPQ